ncbi:peptidoglycan DD-metalloendopeptidase family protein [Pseudanabaenaceae cyanobacterium LEGE 13415]|nr:peptidoglycan DD-metalloendopeptidase family protein [Pseudanabaenaceae cyanobacterium LEGE 13415]
MLELIPTLFAQQQTKQAVVPVQPIEQSATPTQSPAPVVTPASAIATPESTSVSIPATPTPVPTFTAQPLTPIRSQVSLPQVPQKTTPQVLTPKSAESRPVNLPSTTPKLTESRLVNSPSIESKSQPVIVGSDSKVQTAPVRPTARSTPRPTPSVAVETKTPSVPKVETGIEIPVPKPTLQATPQTPKVEAGIEIPVLKPTVQATPQTPTQEQKQLLEQRLADIVARDRQAKQAQQQEDLVAHAYSLATQRRFAQARKVLQSPNIPANVREQILSNINSLESASRTIGVTPIKEPVTKPARATARKPSTPASPIARKPAPQQQAITIQVPRAIQSLPIQRRSPIAVSTAPASSDSAGEYIDQLVTPPRNLQAFNRNLPQPTAKGQIVYPLPEPVPVTSGFGWRRHPVTGTRRFHAGVDLGAAQGTPVIASRGGKVTVADRMGGYGLTIVTQQANGKQDTLYAHLSEIYVRPGETIQPGTIIGRVGSTGLSTGPHLHYEARQMSNTGWVAVNPGAQIEAARARLVQARQQEERSTRTSQGG